MSFHDILRASTAQGSLSGTGDTNMGSFLLNLVANRSKQTAHAGEDEGVGLPGHSFLVATAVDVCEGNWE